ncbi:MAG: carboxypeptidase-like regulatory domain-containing protein, partial [Gemmatimonadaceae bacterium]
MLDGASRAPLGGARVRLSSLRGSDVDSATSSVDGAFRLTRITGGRYVLAVNRLGYSALRDTVDVPPGT